MSNTFTEVVDIFVRILAIIIVVWAVSLFVCAFAIQIFDIVTDNIGNLDIEQEIFNATEYNPTANHPLPNYTLPIRTASRIVYHPPVNNTRNFSQPIPIPQTNTPPPEYSISDPIYPTPNIFTSEIIPNNSLTT